MRTHLHRIHGLVVGSVAISLAGPACSTTSVITIAGNGQSKLEDRQVAAFDAITASESLTVVIVLAPDQPRSVKVSGDDNLVSLVRTTVSDNELTLALDLAPNTNIAPRIPLAITVSTPALHALRADNFAEVVAGAVSGDEVLVESSRSATVKVASITAAKLLTLTSDNAGKLTVAGVTASGPIALKSERSAHLEVMGITASQAIALEAGNAGTIAVSGTAPLLTAQLTRSANLEGQELNATSVVITASKVSRAQICATASLDATLTASSQVAYHCNPGQITRSVDRTSTLTEE